MWGGEVNNLETNKQTTILFKIGVQVETLYVFLLNLLTVYIIFVPLSCFNEMGRGGGALLIDPIKITIFLVFLILRQFFILTGTIGLKISPHTRNLYIGIVCFVRRFY